MAKEEKYQIMSMVTNPDTFVSWSAADKLRFYDKAAQWHEYIADLQRDGHVQDAWGTQKIPGMAFNLAAKVTLIAMYHVTLDQYTDLIIRDPLWNFGVYHAPVLKSIEGDYEDDMARNKRIRDRLTKAGKKLPKPLVKFLDADKIPNVKPGGKLKVLVTLRNAPGYANLPDEQKLVIDERVLQMHQYHQILRDRKIIINEWGCYQNWGFAQADQDVAQAGRHIFQVNTYDEFDALHQLDPEVPLCSVRTMVLVPFEQSKKRAQDAIGLAKQQLA